MSWPIGKVPDGWSRGSELFLKGGAGPRYAVGQYLPPVFDPAAPATGLFLIEFDSCQDVADWWHWWFDGKSWLYDHRGAIEPSLKVREYLILERQI